MKNLIKGILVTVVVIIFLSSGYLLADSHLEISLHYSYWTLNTVRGLVENMVSDTLKSDLKDRFVEQIQNNHPDFVEGSYDQDIDFDAPGHNLGLELRFYPKGQNGAFSLGLAVEQSTMKVSFPQVIAYLEMIDEAVDQSAFFTAVANGEFVIKPLSFHLSMRWEFLPTKAISPYLTVGAGLSTSKSFFNANYEYSYSGTLVLPDSSTEDYADSATKTLQEIKDERLAKGKKFSLNFLPIVQFNLGLRAKISGSLNLILEAGIFNGFLVRGGLAFRI
ncbi:MAG: hypothetical protein PHQ25_04545 [Acidobacteriota bacterium]|nr:hypothetical protein [Acidobacteriota bacterium]MDW3228838.1 hypothetical protein [Acidobacteriota bacterium]MDY0231068.1 hypothetical protein [Candidatus Saccharicenans sp.]